LNSSIITISVGPSERLFAAHEELLAHSPMLANLCNQQFYEVNKKISLPDETPEIFSCVLEYLYKGDYYPRLSYDKRRQSWSLEESASGDANAVIDFMMPGGEVMRVLKDTVLYVSTHQPFKTLANHLKVHC
jgi:hypothetical protein